MSIVSYYLNAHRLGE